MTEFLSILVSLPTLCFTIPLGLAILYWGFAVIGALDIDLIPDLDGLFDGSMDGAVDGAVEGALEGAAEGAAEGLAEGAAEAMAEGAAEAMAEGAAEAVAEGATEAMAEGWAEAAAEGATDAVADGAADAMGHSLLGGPSFLQQFALLILSPLRNRKVPVTVSLSAFFLWGWAATFLLTWATAPFLPWLAMNGVALGGGLVMAYGLTRISTRPLEPLFHVHQATERSELLGQECEITTGKVTNRFGQAVIHEGDMLIQVRCDQSNGLKRGATALLVSYDDHREAFIIEALDVPDGKSKAASSKASQARQRQ